jgi:hypothetical protein
LCCLSFDLRIMVTPIVSSSSSSNKSTFIMGKYKFVGCKWLSICWDFISLQIVSFLNYTRVHCIYEWLFVTRRVSLTEQELFNLSEHLSSLSVFSEVRLANR